MAFKRWFIMTLGNLFNACVVQMVPALSSKLQIVRQCCVHDLLVYVTTLVFLHEVQLTDTPKHMNVNCCNNHGWTHGCEQCLDAS